jgi:multidrug efflux pump subunit AcrB
MKRLIEWAIGNSPAMNVMMISSLIVGLACLMVMRREVFPNFDLEIILIRVPFPGASPEEVEEGICQKLEESLQTVDDVKKMTSVAREGSGFIVLELRSNVKDVQKVLADVESQVDQAKVYFPDLAEDPNIQQISFSAPSITVGIVGPESAGDPDLDFHRDLRTVAEEIRTELLQLPPVPAEGGLIGRITSSFRAADSSKAISSAEIKATKSYQIDVEIPEETLRAHGLTLQQIAQIIRNENTEMPGGKLKSAGQEILVRGKSKRSLGVEIANIKILSQPNVDVVTVDDLGNVVDGFEDKAAFHRIDGRPGLVIEVERTTSEDLFTVVDAVKDYVKKKQPEMPPGYELKTWNDMSLDVRDRLNLLTKNGVQGLVLVFLVLAVFLDLRLAFWVALGIPVSVLGAGYVLLGAGQTLNMLSMFAFLMALGIVVDDAIVIGENIYQHRTLGKSTLQAAIDGTVEVLPSVGASVATTVIAFLPMLFVSGVMGKFIAVMPLAVISMLLISLVESTLVLPCHLAHERNLFTSFLGLALFPISFLKHLFARINLLSQWLLETFVEKIYVPVVRFSLLYRSIVLSGAIGLLIMAGGFVAAGITPFVIFPKLDSRIIIGSVEFPDGTSIAYTKEATRRMEIALQEMNQEFEQEHGVRLISNVHLSVGQVSAGGMGPSATTEGSHVGSVQAELIPVDDREETSDEIVQHWRERVGEIAGAEVVKYGAPSMGPGGTPIEFKLLADRRHADELELAVQDCKDKLNSYEGVMDVQDDSRPGKAEIQLKIRKDAESLGITQDELNRTVRASYFGEEVMRLQRGRHEVKLMVRSPRDQRQSIRDFEKIRLRGSDLLERPITELAEINFARGFSEINRVDQLRSVTVSADVDAAKGGNAFRVTTDLKNSFMADLLKKYPNVTVKWEGQQQQSMESFQSLAIGFAVAMVAMFVLLTMEFRSYLQPIIIMAIIPFGAIGAILGHAVMGLELTLFSVFGMVALTGVVVNDSIVLVDFINHRVRDGMPLHDALVEAGRRRFRPVLLTSLTTIAGLIPILLETSFQAQVLIPMAASLCFGLMTATSLILVLVPVFYSLVFQVVDKFSQATGHAPKMNVEAEVAKLDAAASSATD